MASLLALGLAGPPLEDAKLALEFMPWARDRGWRALPVLKPLYLVFDPQFVAPVYQATMPQRTSQLRLAVERPPPRPGGLAWGLGFVAKQHGPVLLEGGADFAWMDRPHSPIGPSVPVTEVGLELRVGHRMDRWAWYLSLGVLGQRIGGVSGGVAILGLTIRF